jgi:putative flavoprotein involved in K+ transport
MKSHPHRRQVIVIGGGQAGLTAGYFLRKADVPFLILDAETQVGDSWRRRWDSLELFTAARYSSLPGLRFPGDPEHFPGKEEVADYMEQYAGAFELPIELETRVTSVRRPNGGYRLETKSGTYEADRVIVATGAYQRPFVPPLAEKLTDDVTQLHSADYRNPSQVADDEVLVVGSANSGAQIAQDLSSTCRVQLSRGRKLPRLPRRLLGKSLHWWGDKLGLIGAPLNSFRGRTQRGELLVGQSLRQLARRHGVELVSRTFDAEGSKVQLEGGGEVRVSTIIWATGYRSDYSWIDVPIFDERGEPRHQRGVTQAPGLYFLGMHDQYSRGSSLIHWVRDDAKFIVDRACTEALT